MTSIDLQYSIEGVMKEINARQTVIWGMRATLNGTRSTGSYSHRNIIMNGPRIAREIQKLKVIKAELIYLYELSKLK